MRWMLAGLVEPHTMQGHKPTSASRIISLLGRGSFEDSFSNWVRRPNFLFRSILVNCTSGFHFAYEESQIVNMLRQRNIKGRVGLTTECEGKVGVLGIVHLDVPSPTAGLYTTEVFLEFIGGCARIISIGSTQNIGVALGH